ncbi:MAG: ribosome biogenesis GTP-binding protein YihA/YsxC [Ruminococcus sp.]|nr:ribosome biogenesis GTP-binding protein YihA/YsxC [Ruminococcus sp.]MCM1478590.1 ribosome biogenesis GTP-binding protein YihA/YsxC [Muribaculaceae bacterium]
MNFNKAEFYASYGQYKQIPPCEKTEIAFSGRSNVGKSSLINKIFNRKNLARVSSVPGKTATINFYSVDECFMADLPGYGYAKVSKGEKMRWSELIEGYLTSDRDIALVVQLIDMRHPPSADDLHMINFLIDCEQPFIIVFTKADKLSKRQREERMAGFAEEIPYFDQINFAEFSAVTGEGVDKVRSLIEESVLPENE